MLCPCCRNISIHAPPRGATRPVCLLVVVDNNFNSRPSARGDFSICPSTHVSVFQFTPLREGRRSILAKSEVRTYFNSRPSARGDARRDRTPHRRQISIHAPPRGATAGYYGNGAWVLDFNSRPSARGDRVRTFVFVAGNISIHAPPRGATAESFAAEARKYISIHAPPRGATAKDMQFLQIFCSTLTNQHGLTIMPRNLSRLFW